MAYTSINPINFTQSTPSDTWVIAHGSGYFPVIDVSININGTLEKIIPKDIINIDVNTVHVVFSSPQTGMARLC